MDAGMVELLESGCALIVGMVTAAGAPCAGRGWGLTLTGGGTSARVLVDAAIIPTLEHVGDAVIGSHIAVTGCDILTYRSLQLKGPITGIEAPDEADALRSAIYCDDYFGTIEQVDGISKAIAAQMAPDSVTAVLFEIVDIFDQTPGPNAGGAIAR